MSPKKQSECPALYYLGIDGGGTKTAFALGDSKGQILKRLTLGACNPNDVGFPEALQILRQGILDICKGYDFSRISAFAGLAGCSSEENLPRIRDFLNEFGFLRFSNHNDAQNAVAAALEGGDGITVVMGTGSICYAKKGSLLYRVGGYGYLFGDVGSGFALGRDAILAALQMEDKSGCHTLLHSLVTQKCGKATVLSAIDVFYQKGKKEIASFAPLVFEAYLLGDKRAEEILKANLNGIADLICGAESYFDLDHIPLVFCGGLTGASDIWMPLLQEILRSRSKRNFKTSICKNEPVLGALLLAGMPNPNTISKK